MPDSNRRFALIKLGLILTGIGMGIGLILNMGLWHRQFLPPGPEAVSAFAYQKLIRFQVVANSDGLEDQKLKMRVRDRIIAELKPVLSQAASVEEARRLVAENLPRVETAVQDTLRQNNNNYPLKAEFGQFVFPAKLYHGAVLPSGTYTALRVSIGQGAGQNWWCVLFPPLCFVDCAGSGPALVNPRWNEEWDDPGSPVLAPGSDEPAGPAAEPVLKQIPQFRLRVLDLLSG